MLSLKEILFFFFFICFFFCAAIFFASAFAQCIYSTAAKSYKRDQRSHLGKTIDALSIGDNFDTLLIKFMQTAQLTFNGRTITEFFAVLFLFRCREMVRDPPNSPRSVICWDLFLYFWGTLWCYKWATQ